jgi:hypothetical protein
MDRTKVKVIGKKILWGLKVFVICSIILTVLEVGIGFWLVKTRWKMHISNNEMKEFAKELTDSQPLPENFIRIYQTISPNHINTTMTEMIVFNYIVRLVFRDYDYDTKPHCYCDLIYDIQVKQNAKLRDIEWTGRVVDMEYGFGLEKYTTPDKCFTYFINQHINQVFSRLDHNLYPNMTRDNVANMSDDEIIELLLLLKSVDRFNKFKNPELFDKYLHEYRLKLQMANTASK